MPKGDFEHLEEVPGGLSSKAIDRCPALAGLFIKWREINFQVPQFPLQSQIDIWVRHILRFNFDSFPKPNCLVFLMA